MKGTPTFCKKSLFGVQKTPERNTTGHLLVSLRGKSKCITEWARLCVYPGMTIKISMFTLFFTLPLRSDGENRKLLSLRHPEQEEEVSLCPTWCPAIWTRKELHPKVPGDAGKGRQGMTASELDQDGKSLSGMFTLDYIGLGLVGLRWTGLAGLELGWVVLG